MIEDQSFSVEQRGKSQEGDVYRLAMDNDSLSDLVDLCGVTPFGALLNKEEQSLLASHRTSEEMEIRKEAINALMACYLFKPVNNRMPTPHETTVRLWTLCYSLSPALIGGLSLEQIGEMFTAKKLTRAALSKRVLNLDDALNLHARNRKSSEAVEKYRETATATHAARREKVLRERRRIYNFSYKSARREQLKAANREYYAKNRKRILGALHKKRNYEPQN